MGTQAKSLRITSESSISRIARGRGGGVILFFSLSLSLSLSTYFVPTCSAYLDYNLLNLHVAMCDNDNVEISFTLCFFKLKCGKLRLIRVLGVRVWNETMLRTYDCEY
jgi:hypothetical protein